MSPSSPLEVEIEGMHTWEGNGACSEFLQPFLNKSWTFLGPGTGPLNQSTEAQKATQKTRGCRVLNSFLCGLSDPLFSGTAI